MRFGVFSLEFGDLLAYAQVVFGGKVCFFFMLVKALVLWNRDYGFGIWVPDFWFRI